eukprot:gene6607-7300_t
MTNLAADIRSRIAAHAERLKSEPELAARVKKRIFQKIGKLKSELAALGESYTDQPAGVTDLVEEEGVEKKEEHGEEQEDEEEEERPAKKARVELSRKEAKAMTHFLVKQLADLAVKKQLSRAKQIVKQHVKRGLRLDVHVFTNLLNVHMRCHDLDGGAALLRRMQDEGVQPNEVTYTTLLKGYCELGRIASAAALYEEMRGHGEHNLRSLTTFLRGCMRTGAIGRALQAYSQGSRILERAAAEQEQQEEEVQQGDHWNRCAILEAMASLLCRSLRFDDARLVLLQLPGDSLESASVQVLFARVSLLLGLRGEAAKHLNVAKELVRKSTAGRLAGKMRAKLLHEEDGAAAGGGGGESSQLFQAHKHTLLSSEIEQLEDALAVRPASSSSEGEERVIASACRGYARALSKMLYFGFDGQGDRDDEVLAKEAVQQQQEKVQEGLFLAVKEKLGLLRTSPEEVCLSVTGQAKAFPPALLARHEKEILRTEAKLRGCFDAKGRLDLSKVFSIREEKEEEQEEQEGKDKKRRPPVFLEVGAGHGDWVVAQAAHHRNHGGSSRRGTATATVEAHWLALELRWDRAHDILLKDIQTRCEEQVGLTNANTNAKAAQENDEEDDDDAVVPGESNLCVLGGDAVQIVSRHLSSACVEGIFINYPQPPDQQGQQRLSGKTTLDQHAAKTHLLTAPFLAQLRRLLVPESGTLTILTDNLNYGMLLARTATAHYRDARVQEEEVRGQQGITVQELFLRKEGCPEEGSITLYRGHPGPQHGHHVDVQSYFDHLWTAGQKRRRWFLHLRPV